MRWYIIAGEASGDLHASNLMRGIYLADPEAEIRFRGGDMMLSVFNRMQKNKAGGLAAHYREGAVMGLAEILLKAGKFIRSVNECKKDIMEWKPDAVVLVDYPGFNFKIARFAHKMGFKVLWYIAPKTWASRESRNKKLKKWVDMLFVVFPFELQYFKDAGVPYVYKGNPLLDAVDNSPAMAQPREEFLAAHSLPDKKFLALLAGSRKEEIKRMMPVYMQLADELARTKGFEDFEFLLAGAPARSREDYEVWIAGRSNVHLIFNDTYGILHNSVSAVINSGTASLEAALIGTPQVVCWTTSAVNAFIAQNIFHILDRIKYISLGNLILDKSVFRELIQTDFTLENVLAEVQSITLDDTRRCAMLADYAQIRASLGGTGTSIAVAQSMVDLIK